MTGFTKRLSACLLSTALILSLSCNVLATDDSSVLTTESEVGDSGGIPEEEEQSTDSEDKKTVIKRFDIKSILEEQPMVSTYAEEILDPMDLIQRYQEERASLNSMIDRRRSPLLGEGRCNDPTGTEKQHFSAGYPGETGGAMYFVSFPFVVFVRRLPSTS